MKKAKPASAKTASGTATAGPMIAPRFLFDGEGAEVGSEEVDVVEAGAADGRVSVVRKVDVRVLEPPEGFVMMEVRTTVMGWVLLAWFELGGEVELLTEKSDVIKDELATAIPCVAVLPTVELLGTASDAEEEDTEGDIGSGVAVELLGEVEDTGCCGIKVVPGRFDDITGATPVGESLPIEAITFPTCS